MYDVNCDFFINGLCYVEMSPLYTTYYILSLYPATLLNLLYVCVYGGDGWESELPSLYIARFEFFVILKYSYWNNLMYFVSFISVLAVLFS